MSITSTPIFLLAPSGRKVVCLEVESAHTCHLVDVYDLDDGWFGAAIYAVDDTASPLASAIYSTTLPAGQPDPAHLERRRCAGVELEDSTWRAIDHAVARAVTP